MTDAGVPTLIGFERDLLRERFIDFERGVLQENIALCDAKSGVLLAFAGAMIVFCVDTVAGHAHPGPAWRTWLVDGLFLVAAAVFLVSCHFSLTTVLPRLRRGRDDHIFWESPVFRLEPDAYVQQMEALDVVTERTDKLLHLHMLAGICRVKFGHFGLAVRFGQIGFLILVAAELVRIIR